MGFRGESDWALKWQRIKKPLTRFAEFELLKAIAIMGLMAIHLMEEALEAGYASPGLQALGDFIIGLCAFGPSVFMICMGFGIGGGRSSADSIRKIGIQFLLIGAILNLFRWLLPGIISHFVLNTRLIDDINFYLQSDIYYFAGLFYIFYFFIKKRKLSTASLLMISVLMLTANTLLTRLTRGAIKNEIVSSLLGNLVYVDEHSCFPLLSWAIFPSVGILLGDVLKSSDEEKREFFMRRVTDFSMVLLISFSVFLWDYNIDLVKALISPANDYITDLPNVILLLSFALLLIGLTYQLCKHIGALPFMGFMLRVSAYIIPFYLLQWIIIAWIFYLLPMLGAEKGCFNLGWYCFSVIAVTAICTWIATRYGMKIMRKLLKVTSFRKRRKKS